MKDFVRQAAPYLFVATVSFLVGLFVALSIDPNSSCYVEAKFGKNTGITLGRNRITDFDLSSVRKDEVAQLRSKIKDLDYFDFLSVALRDLRDQAAGPFKVHDIDIRVKFTNDNNFSGNLAQACPGEVLFKELNVFRIITPAIPSLNVNEMRDFKVLLEKEKCFCAAPNVDRKTIWINEKAARKWLKTGKDELPAEIRAKASILRTIMYNDDSAMTNAMPKHVELNET